MAGGLLAVCASAAGADLVSATVRVEDGRSVAFLITGESRQQVVGGRLVLGERTFTITRVSRHGLIGASRRVDQAAEPRHYGEFAVFSSSFSDQTAVGEPWVAARRHLHCDTPYNSFLAVYRVDGEAALAALGDVPYPAVTDDSERSDDSAVYCFTSGRATGG